MGRGAKYINLRVRIKILFINIHTSIYFFQGWGDGPPLPLSSSVPATFECLTSIQKVEFVTQEFKIFKEEGKKKSPRDRRWEWLLSYFVGLADYFWWNSWYVNYFLDRLILYICTLFIFILWIYVCIDAWLWVCIVYKCIYMHM